MLDSVGPGTYQTGTDPGYYPEEKVTAFEKQWDEAQALADKSSATDAELAEAEKALRQALNDVTGNQIQITDGYYRFISASEAYQTLQGVDKALIGNTTESRMAWGNLDEEDPYQVFKVTKLASGNYSIQCVGNQRFIDWVNGDACLTTAAYNLPLVE